VVGARFNTDRDSPSELQVESVRAHKDGLLLAFAGISTRNEAESLRGITLTIARSERRDLDAGEYWEDDLIGLTAVDTSGVTLGIVASIVTGAAQDRLVVDTDAGPVEVPFVDAIVIDVAIADGRVVIDAPEGLF
jgi:16S rRNA processing protein RimM